MKNNKITPLGFKGKEIDARMKELMGIKPINEDIKKSAVELTKMGPDGKVYAIVRENHEYYIKITNKTNNLVVEDFNYIGGLQNKKSEAYPSYAKAIKHLNLKFLSINEAYGKSGQINVFEDDNLLIEHHPYKADQKLSSTKGMGDATEYIVDDAGEELSYDAKEGKKDGQFGDNLANGKTKNDVEKVKLTEVEQAIDDMLEKEEEEIKNPGKYIGGEKNKLGLDDDGDGVPNGADKDPKDGSIKESKLSIARALDQMDSIIEALSEGTVKKKVYSIK
jgi:hypothetical protein